MTARWRGTVVLCYHRVAVPGSDPHGLSVHPDRFADQLSTLLRVADAVPVADAARPSRMRRRVAVTFDDGYHDSLDTALPLLADAGVPSTFFITTGTLDHAEFWWDRLARLLLHPAASGHLLEFELAKRPLWLDARSPAGRRRAHWALWHRLRLRPFEEIQEVLDDLEALLGGQAPAPTARPLTTEELRELASAAHVGIGAHSVTHPSLAGLAPQEREREVAGSREHLESLLATPVRFFAYPYGGASDVDDHTAACAARAGFAGAFTTMAGTLRPRQDPWRLPRLVVGDWDGDRLVAELAALRD